MGSNHSSNEPSFYGLATVGTKGQLVIPAKAREEFGIQAGDTMVIIGIKDHAMLGICPVSSVEEMLSQMAKRMEQIQAVVEKSKQEKGA